MHLFGVRAKKVVPVRIVVPLESPDENQRYPRQKAVTSAWPVLLRVLQPTLAPRLPSVDKAQAPVPAMEGG